MKISQSINQKLAMKLSTKMQSSLQILQMSNLEFNQYLNEKVVENVLLEMETPEYKLDFRNIRKNSRGNDVRGFDMLQNLTVLKKSEQQFIEDWIFEQLPYDLKLPKGQFNLLNYLIKHLNSDGYLEISLLEASSKFNVSYNEAEKILGIIQHLNPKGIGARSLKECLLLQIEHSKGADHIAYKILDLYNSNLLNKDYKLIMKELNCSIKEIKQTLSFLQTLNARPLAQFIPTEANYIAPDIIIGKNKGQFYIQVNKANTPKVTISKSYEQNISALDDASKKFLKNHYNEASFLLHAIEQREQTLYKLGMAFITLQQDFLEYGMSALKPMKLKDIAELLDVHESTVSRAVRNKYIQTPIGLFEISNLFINGIENEHGDVLSTNVVKDFIIKLIKQEDKMKPLSDQKIGDILEKQGISISRRTVTKYREALGILSSRQRMQFE